MILKRPQISTSSPPFFQYIVKVLQEKICLELVVLCSSSNPQLPSPTLPLLSWGVISIIYVFSTYLQHMLGPYGWPAARSKTELVSDQHLKRLKYHMKLDSESVICLFATTARSLSDCIRGDWLNGPRCSRLQTPQVTEHIVHFDQYSRLSWCYIGMT